MSARIARGAKIEDDAFTNVTNRSKNSAASIKPYRSSTTTPLSQVKMNSQMPGGTSRASNFSPSAAAASRANIYTTKPKTPSGYKQEFLPIEERDPALVLAQANKGIRMAKEAFKPGMIIRAPVHEQDLKGGTSNITAADKYTTDSKFGPIYTKYRKLIVIALFQNHYLAAPLYTHNGRGLVDKANPNEYVSVQDHRARGFITPLSKHLPLVTEFFNPGIDLIHPKSTVHITYPLPRRYDLPVIYEGYIKEDSVARLNELFNMFILRK